MQRPRQAVLLKSTLGILLEDSHLHLALLFDNTWGTMTGYNHGIYSSQSWISWHVACPIRAIVREYKLIFMTWCGYLRRFLSVFGISLSHHHPIALVSVTAEEILSALSRRGAQPFLILH